MLTVIASVVVTIALILLFLLFYYQDKRLITTQQLLAQAIAESKERLALLDENQKTLRENDDILAKDIETLLHEFKGIEKKIKVK